MHTLLRNILAVICLAFCALSARAQDFSGPIDRGVFNDSLLDEASGLCCSRLRPDILWTHNDSGDSARIFAATTSAKIVAVYYLKGISARDWEDICSDTIAGKAYLYIGETGDNNAVYDTKTIYRVLEPSVDPDQKFSVDTIRSIDAIRFQYPDGKRDAECVMSDPRTHDLYVVSKREDSVRVYRLAYPQSTTDIITAEKVATIPYTMITAGDISADGSEIVIKDYQHIFYFKRGAKQSVADALRGTPGIEPYSMEPQGEAIAFDAESKGYYTTSEMSPLKVPAHLYFYERLQSGVGSETSAAGLRIDSIVNDPSGRMITAHVNFSLDASVTVQIYTVRGGLVLSSPHMSYRSGAQEVRVQTPGLSSGIYYMRFLGRGINEQKSFFVQK